MLICSFSSEKARILKKVLRVVCDISTGNRPLVFTKNGIMFQSVEESGTCFIMFKINLNFFDEFKTELFTSPVTHGINLEYLNSIFNLDVEGPAQYQILEDKVKQKLVIRIINSQIKRSYGIPLTHLNTERINYSKQVLDLEFTHNVTLAPNVFNESIDTIGLLEYKQHGIFQLLITSDELKFDLYTKDGKDLDAKGQISLSLDTNSSTILDVSIDPQSHDIFFSKYDMDYIERLRKLDMYSKLTTLEFGVRKSTASGSPIRVKFDLQDIDFTFVIAHLLK